MKASVRLVVCLITRQTTTPPLLYWCRDGIHTWWDVLYLFWYIQWSYESTYIAYCTINKYRFL